MTVLREALALSAASEGCFDVSIGAAMMARGLLPEPAACALPDPAASWRDIELIGPDRVRFHRPLFVDLGGIAKGYAVDCAIDALKSAGVARACVNAGGDLRVLGDVAEHVTLRTHRDAGIAALPMFSIADGSLASSGALDGDGAIAHIDPRHPGQRLSQCFASVAAERCLIADALTKIVLARSVEADPLLRRYSARALFLDKTGEWRRIGTWT